MKKQTEARLLELVVLLVITFCLSMYFSRIQFAGRGFSYLGAYLGQMSIAIIISSIISLIYYLRTKRFFRFFLNSLWITTAISFWLLSRSFGWEKYYYLTPALQHCRVNKEWQLSLFVFIYGLVTLLVMGIFVHLEMWYICNCGKSRNFVKIICNGRRFDG